MAQRKLVAPRSTKRSGRPVSDTAADLQSEDPNEQAVADVEAVEAKVAPGDGKGGKQGKATGGVKVLLFPTEAILVAVGVEFAVTRAQLTDPTNQKSWPTRVAIFLILFEGSDASLNRVAQVMNAESGGKLRDIYAKIKAELGLKPEEIERIEKIRRALRRVGPKASLGHTVWGLLGLKPGQTSVPLRRGVPQSDQDLKVAPAPADGAEDEEEAGDEGEEPELDGTLPEDALAAEETEEE